MNIGNKNCRKVSLNINTFQKNIKIMRMTKPSRNYAMFTAKCSDSQKNLALKFELKPNSISLIFPSFLISSVVLRHLKTWQNTALVYNFSLTVPCWLSFHFFAYFTFSELQCLITISFENVYFKKCINLLFPNKKKIITN